MLINTVEDKDVNNGLKETLDMFTLYEAKFLVVILRVILDISILINPL